ncbi:MAG: hypothetical protein CVV27_19070 [Candidatus Melainabacteria bacterium HGW-Melainabacteria-1]|nr:MAG: hypothetical protein CVV27_19070 [Candidatus Melainabacteria bacterium HGW-Melainabacteria-1]
MPTDTTPHSSDTDTDLAVDLATDPTLDSTQPAKPKLDITEMAISFVMPALFGKLLILYFGSNYSSKPGQGYGIGLSITILFTLVMLGRFVWRYKDYSED